MSVPQVCRASCNLITVDQRPLLVSGTHRIAKEAMIKSGKQFRVLYRSADGCATYLAVTGEGSELLRISSDGPP
jgi:hypothetical protein